MNNDARAVLHLLSRRSSSGTDEDQHENEELDINNNAIAKEDNEDNFYEEGYDERSLEQSHKCISDSDYTSSSILTLYNHHKRDSTRIDQQNPSMQRRADSVCKFVEPASISRGRGIYRRSVTSLDINNESKSNFSHPTSNGYLNDRRSPPPPHWPVTKTGLTYESKISPIFKNNYTFTTAALTTRQCSVDVQSIDFSFKIRDLSIIINSDDLKTCKGYEKACVLLKSKRLAYTGLNTYPDIWHFNLWKYKIQFLPIQTKFCPRMPINVDDLEYPTFPIQELTKWMKNDHYWFMIKDQPKFIDTYFNETKSSMPESTIIKSHTKLGAVSFKETIHLELSYGALISQTHYVEHPKYVLKKKSKWYIAFYQRKFEIVIQNNRLCKRVIKQIPVELIDRTAIFKLEQNSFTLYLCMRGNVHEYESTTYTNNNNSKNGNHQPKATTSQTSARRRISRLMPTFSTTRLTVSCKADEMSQEYFKNRKNNNNTRHEQHFDLIKQESFAQIKELFKHLLNFFYSNTIQVCFAAIQNKDGITNCSSILFPTRLQTYAFQMLNDIGYRVQYNIYQSQLFCEQMKQIACQKNKDYEINLDDRFYCLCMYLHCRLSESHFADLMGELTAGIKEYKNKLERSFLSGIQMPSLNTSPKPNHLYIYSVTITPTTICTKPIKLCKTNRILREELFGSKMNFALVELRDEANKPLYKQTFLDIREVLNNYLTKGFRIVEYQYKYLHHSQSQVKDKQFWSYCDEQQCGGISIEAAYSWMGNFDNEKVVAKHSARIALCFTSTSPTIKIGAELVTYIRDIKSENGKYNFTDGVGAISSTLNAQIQICMKKRFPSSVLQIRYGGCKGTVSVDPKLDNQQHQLIIRDSMRKFTSDHDTLEVCKLSAPRPLHLNRQVIVLLSNRNVHDSKFLTLQNENHLWLVQSLLSSSGAFELLNEKVINVFRFRELAQKFNIVEEPFFLQLLTITAHSCVGKFASQSRIRIPKSKGRNMFGVVDEYGVLDYGQVFIQFTHLENEKLYEQRPTQKYQTEILNNVLVVITKNPCHHPGDIRTFVAIDHPELRHLKDVVVFPQKGVRPHPNEISGSDLDGDEYVVIWDSDLIPTTPNQPAYDYDSQNKPSEKKSHITRADIIDIVLNIAQENSTGELSNLHLSLSDKYGINSKVCIKLAGFISQELDSPKTGIHPVSDEQMFEYRSRLNYEYPDFMMKQNYKAYPSPNILGKLYRSALRALPSWKRATTNHCSQRFRSAFVAAIRQTESDESLPVPLNLDQTLIHKSYAKYRHQAQQLFSIYRFELLNIISVYHFQDEIDLFCRCEAIEQSSGHMDLELSAQYELEHLITRIRKEFFHEFDQVQVKNNEKTESSLQHSLEHSLHPGDCTQDHECHACHELKLAKASACYVICYERAQKMSTKARQRILSFPWLFGLQLCDVRQYNLNQSKSTDSINKTEYIVVERAMKNALEKLVEQKQLKFKVLIPVYTENCIIFLRKMSTINSIVTNESLPSTPLSFLLMKRQEPDVEISHVNIFKLSFVEILHHWLSINQKVFGETSSSIDKKPLIPETIWHQLMINFLNNTNGNENLYRVVFHQNVGQMNQMMNRYYELVQQHLLMNQSVWDNKIFYDLFDELLKKCFEYSRRYESTDMAYLGEYLILALQSIGLEKELTNLMLFDS